MEKLLALCEARTLTFHVDGDAHRRTLGGLDPHWVWRFKLTLRSPHGVVCESWADDLDSAVDACGLYLRQKEGARANETPGH